MAHGATHDGEVDDGRITRTKIYHNDVAAAYDAHSSTDSSQLFYGPSSNFAFLQQIHRGIILASGRRLCRNGNNAGFDEVGAGLDMFMQRPIFFGTPLRADTVELANPNMLPREMAEHFLACYNHSVTLALPFVPRTSGLDSLLKSFYEGPWPESDLYNQRIAVLFIALAVGALCTPQTKIAEGLFLCARRAGSPYEDAVTVPMIQFSLLLAEYQLNMARCNSAWLSVGNAYRKALAFGLLSASIVGPVQREGEAEATMWGLYFIDVWLSVLTGRKANIKECDIMFPLPAGQPVLKMLCRLASIFEQALTSMYSRKTESIRQLHVAAKRIHDQLEHYADTFGISSLTSMRDGNTFVRNPVAMLMINNRQFLCLPPPFVLLQMY